MPNFNIIISATDKATATVRKVNDAFDKLSRPFKEVGKSFKGLGRELGFEKIGKNLGTIQNSAITAARGLGSIVAPLSAITGVASVSGVVALADGWAKVGRSITYASQNSGVGVKGLQEIEGAAQLVGVASGTATQGLESLGTTMQDALYGRNQQALMLFNRLGVGIKKTATGAVDAEGQFKALAKSIYGLKDAQQQNLVAGQFGLTGLLPLIRQGPAGIEKLTSRARELGLVMDDAALNSATDFANNLEAVEGAGRGLRNELGNALIPAIKPLVIQLSSWISKNRELIAGKVGEWAKNFGQWINSIDWDRVGKGISDFAKDIKSTVDWLGGWKNAAIAVALVMNAQLIVSVVSLSGSLIKAGAGILAYIGQLGAMEAAAGAAAAANGAVGMSAGAAIGRAGLYGAAGLGGVYIGSKISDAMDGTKVGDKFSHYNTKALGDLLSAIGFKDNQYARAAQSDGYDQKYNGAPAASVDRGLQARVVSFFEKQGWSRNKAAGIAANLSTESALNPHALGDNGQAYGLAQWHPDRQKDFANWAGRGIQGSSLEDQLKFVQYELTKGNEKSAGDALRNAPDDPRIAGAIVSSQFERPKDTVGEATRRGNLASEIASSDVLSPTSLTKPTKPAVQEGGAQETAPQGPYSSGAAKDGAVKVEVELKNAPAGTTATAKSTGNATTSPPRIGYSGVGATM